MKRLHLLIAGLDAGASADFPHLAKLIARGSAEAPADAGLSAGLARMFGLDIEELAAIALAAEGIDPGADAWFHADPVHLLAGMHSLTLFDRRQLQLRTDESTTLVAALNRHFEGEIEFLAPHPTRWYARFKKSPRVEAPPLDQVAGRTIAPDLVAGPDARELQRAAMECQMLLHAHPINEAREQRGLPTVNSIWYWGGMPFRRPSAGFSRVLSDDFTAHALARAAGIGHGLPTESADTAGDTLVAIADPSAMPDLDTRWFEKTLTGLQKQAIAGADLSLVGHAGYRCRIGRRQALAFWRNRI